MKLNQEDLEEAWAHVINNNIYILRPVDNHWIVVYLRDNKDIAEIDGKVKASPFTEWMAGNQDLYAKEGGHYEDEKQGITIPEDTDYHGYNE